MRTSSYPPFVVFFDTVAILLFILILNQNKGISFKIPEEQLFQGARLVYLVDDELRYVDSGTQVDTFTPDVLYMAPCTAQFECVAAGRSLESKDIKILFPDALTSEISKITTLAIKSGCSGFTPVVAEVGSLDREATLRENPCMSTIPGLEIWLNRQR
jgi:hypothetical protein